MNNHNRLKASDVVKRRIKANLSKLLFMLVDKLPTNFGLDGIIKRHVEGKLLEVRNISRVIFINIFLLMVVMAWLRIVRFVLSIKLIHLTLPVENIFG